MKNRPLGYENDNLIILPVKSEDLQRSFEAFRNEGLVSFTENMFSVQLIHRHFALIVVLLSFGLWMAARKASVSPPRLVKRPRSSIHFLQ